MVAVEIPDECKDKGCATVRVLANELENNQKRMDDFLDQSKSCLAQQLQATAEISDAVHKLRTSMSNHTKQLEDGDYTFHSLRDQLNGVGGKVEDLRGDVKVVLAWKKKCEFEKAEQDKVRWQSEALGSGFMPESHLGGRSRLGFGSRIGIGAKYTGGAGLIFLLYELASAFLKAKGIMPW